MKTDLAPTLTPDLELMPRADLPVIWDEFRAKAEQLRETANTLVVSSVEEKDKMELARTTRLTLKQIRVAVEKKRIELGQGHLAEIQKINGAANKLKELIEPLEARLLEQESFAERAEKKRIVELAEQRAYEIRALGTGRAFNPHQLVAGMSLGNLTPETYDAYIAQLRAEAAEIAEAKRKQAEAEAALAARVAEEKRLRDEQAAALAAQQAEAQRQARAAAAEEEIRRAAERAEHKRQEEELLARFAEERAKENAARAAREVEEKKVRDEQEAVRRAELEAEIAKHKAERAIEEAKRLELEVQLANERAAKLAEERRLHALAVSPDKEQLKAFHNSIYQVPQPDLKTPEGVAILNRVQCKIAEAFLIIDVFCAE